MGKRGFERPGWGGGSRNSRSSQDVCSRGNLSHYSLTTYADEALPGGTPTIIGGIPAPGGIIPAPGGIIPPIVAPWWYPWSSRARGHAWLHHGGDVRGLRLSRSGRLKGGSWFVIFIVLIRVILLSPCSRGIMFTSQTSSFQDSIDVEERDDFDSEEITGYIQKTQLNSYYTIYLYQGTSLTLIDSSLPSEAEPELRTYISRRLSKGALLGGMGNIATVELSIPEQAVGCYCCLVEQERSPEQPDADGNGYLLNLESEVRPYLSRWYEESVMHIHRVVQLVQNNISFLLHAALSHTLVEGLSQQDTTTASLCKAISEDTKSDLIIDCSTSPPLSLTLFYSMFSPPVSNRFCDDWSQAFLNAAERCNPFLLRQILENFKLKAIQDMNSLKRLVRQAEMSHYALFRSCRFLQGCGNGDVLLQNARAEHSDMPEACSIITVLEEFLRDQSQAHA
ncbi:hypothetical protein F7725_003541 [Dissostichus mawsoni]|uniref:Protein Njmu-R1 n=1 Tax=Dissostichus mawsoni TaxID=36200 RepID=A0A7J5YBH4_DISMA|nr:hypothetical protein F7725_003541 [Dissostichus mawsoni]